MNKKKSFVNCRLIPNISPLEKQPDCWGGKNVLFRELFKRRNVLLAQPIFMLFARECEGSEPDSDQMLLYEENGQQILERCNDFFKKTPGWKWDLMF